MTGAWFADALHGPDGTADQAGGTAELAGGAADPAGGAEFGDPLASAGLTGEDWEPFALPALPVAAGADRRAAEALVQADSPLRWVP